MPDPVSWYVLCTPECVHGCTQAVCAYHRVVDLAEMRIVGAPWAPNDYSINTLCVTAVLVAVLYTRVVQLVHYFSCFSMLWALASFMMALMTPSLIVSWPLTSWLAGAEGGG